MTINNKSERNYRGKCLGWPVTSYGGVLEHHQVLTDILRLLTVLREFVFKHFFIVSCIAKSSFPEINDKARIFMFYPDLQKV